MSPHLKGFFLPTLLALACCAREMGHRAPQRLEQVAVIAAAAQLIQTEHTTFGTVMYANKADVYPTTEGSLEALYAEEGSRVQADQLLAKLDQKKLRLRREQSEAEAASKQALLSLAEERLREGIMAFEARLIGIRNAHAELEQKRSEFDGISLVFQNKQKLFDAGGVAREELEAVRTQFLSYKTRLIQAEGELERQKIGLRDEDLLSSGFAVPQREEERLKLLLRLNTGMLEAEKRVAEAELNAAASTLKSIDLLLEETLILAPISGIVGTRYLDTGEKVTPETKLFTLFNTEKVYIQIEVSENDLPRIKPGQRALINPDQQGRQKITGEVHLISPYVNPETRACRVKVAADNPDQLLVPGQFVRLTIITGSALERITLPESAVLVDDRNRPFVLILRQGRLFRRQVQTDLKLEGKIIILAGIEKGDTVCSKPSYSYREGMEVEPIR